MKPVPVRVAYLPKVRHYEMQHWTDAYLKLVQRVNRDVCRAMTELANRGIRPTFIVNKVPLTIDVIFDERLRMIDSYSGIPGNNSGIVVIGLKTGRWLRNIDMPAVLAHEIAHCYTPVRATITNRRIEATIPHDEQPWEMYVDKVAATVVGYCIRERKYKRTKDSGVVQLRLFE